MPLHRRTPPLSSLQVPALGACLLSSLLTVSLPAQAEQTAASTRWVSDSLTSFVRSGPTDGYRIVGTLSSGQQVELLGSQGDYSQVRTPMAMPCGFPAATCRASLARPSVCHNWNSR